VFRVRAPRSFRMRLSSSVAVEAAIRRPARPNRFVGSGERLADTGAARGNSDGEEWLDEAVDRVPDRS
jgi:hypothetical protein